MQRIASVDCPYGEKCSRQATIRDARDCSSLVSLIPAAVDASTRAGLVVVVAPGVILFLLGFRAPSEIDMIPMGFAFPSGVETSFVAIPHMIIVVIAVVIGDARRASRDK